MPHFIIDCSESILRLADPDELMQSVYAAAESTGLFAKSTRMQTSPRNSSSAFAF
jgi:5-carboxymethyl-2-hydroxymuconate isomerase